MKTLKELKEFCERNNVKHELNPKYAKDEYYSFVTNKFEKIQVGWYFGMNNLSGKKGKSEWNWVWFECYSETANDDTNFYFAERYSMLNGKSYCGIREGISAERTIERRMA